MPRPALPLLVAWVGAQAGFATVSGLGRCPGRLCHGGVTALPRLVAWVGAQG